MSDTAREPTQQLSVTLNSAALLKLLLGHDEHLPPEKILGGLSGAQACAAVPGSPHSIATLLGHMVFWQERRLGYARGETQPDFDETVNFPLIQPAQWQALLQRFLGGFAQLTAIAAEADTSREIWEGRSLGFMLASQACHSSYHLGQIVLLRRIQGSWPAH